MFDIGFTEIILIAVVGLIVIGPKRLPETVRFLGYWLGKLRRSVQGARQDMEREFGLDEIRRELYNEELLGRMEKERKQIEKRLGSPSPSDEATPANLKTPNEEDFIDDESGDARPTGSQPSDAQSSLAHSTNQASTEEQHSNKQISDSSDNTTRDSNPSSSNLSTTKTTADKAP